jgi:hypothetical protein
MANVNFSNCVLFLRVLHVYTVLESCILGKQAEPGKEEEDGEGDTAGAQHAATGSTAPQTGQQIQHAAPQHLRQVNWFIMPLHST